MVDPDKKIARPVGGEAPERVPWSVRDAMLMQGIGLIWRLIIGFFAALIGVLCLYVVFTSVPAIAAKGAFAANEPVWAFFLFAVIGGGLSAFAAGQVLQLMWVGGDQGYDQRLWARMTSRERGLWTLREAGSGRWTFQLFIVLALAAMLYTDAFLLPLLWREALAGRWLPAATAFLCTAAMAWLAVWIFRSSGSPPSAGQASTWVSQGRWVFYPREITVTEARIALGIGLAALGMAAIMHNAKPNDGEAVGMAISGGAALLIGAWLLFQALRERRGPATKLEIVREVDRPLTLACTVTLPLPAEEVARVDWLARFAAYYGYRMVQTDKKWQRWLDVTAPVEVVQGASSVRFTLRVDVPKDMPNFFPPMWLIRLESRSGRRKPFEFVLPPQIVFTEEYPAG